MWSGFNLGQTDSEVEWCQEMLGVPTTGVWRQVDEDSYLDYLEVAATEWDIISSFFPRNWITVSIGGFSA